MKREFFYLSSWLKQGKIVERNGVESFLAGGYKPNLI